MELRQAASALQISSYPSALEEIAKNTDRPESFCSAEQIRHLEDEYELFGEYYNDVQRGLQSLLQDPVRVCWASAVSRYIGMISCGDARNIPVPLSDGSPAGDMLPLLTLIPHIPASVEMYRKRGLTKDEIHRLMRTYKSSIATVHARSGRPGIDKTYYSWLCIYVKAMLFRHDGFNYEVKPLPGGMLILKNRKNGELATLPVQKKIHASGLIFGSAGCTDEEGTFTAALTETKAGYTGFRAIQGKIKEERIFFPISEWECILRPDDPILNVHIPRGTDLSPEKTLSSFAGAMTFAQKAYPEFHVSRIFCCSWLLDPAIGALLDGKSKIAAYGDLFERFPVSSAGKEVFSFVFSRTYSDYRDLPENTRLERALKSLYLQGGYVHAFAGVLKEGLL